MGKAELSPYATAKLDQFAWKAGRTNIEVVTVVGYADSQGSAAYNQSLSVRRAESVKNYLVAKGFEKNRIYIEGKGGIQGDNIRSRRVELEVVGSAIKVPIDGSGQETDIQRELRRRQVPVLFGTTRARTNTNVPDEFYSDAMETAPNAPHLRLGRAVVQVPLSHSSGAVERPGWIDKLIAAIQQKTLNDPKRYFGITSDIEELTEGDLVVDLRQAMGGSASKSAIVYVHGFANDFTDALFRVAQLSYDLRAGGYDAVPLLFSWPSDYQKVNYVSAKDRVEHAAQNLKVFLELISSDPDLGAIHIVGHSMGTHVVAAAMQKLGSGGLVVNKADGSVRSRFQMVVLAAADIPRNVFPGLIRPLIDSKHRIVSYVSGSDRALQYSKGPNGQPRAGDAMPEPLALVGVETVDASKYRGHSYFAEEVNVVRDLRIVLKDGLLPEQRGLKRVRRGPASYWKF